MFLLSQTVLNLNQMYTEQFDYIKATTNFTENTRKKTPFIKFFSHCPFPSLGTCNCICKRIYFKSQGFEIFSYNKIQLLNMFLKIVPGGEIWQKSRNFCVVFV